jgi:hypothetical protein
MGPNTWIAMLAALLTVAAGGAHAASPTEARVSINQFKFEPAVVAVATGMPAAPRCSHCLVNSSYTASAKASSFVVTAPPSPVVTIFRG